MNIRNAAGDWLGVLMVEVDPTLTVFVMPVAVPIDAWCN